MFLFFFFFFKQKTAYEIYQCDWSSDVCSSDLSSILQGTRANQLYNPLEVKKYMQFKSDDFLPTKQFCLCPVCMETNYNKLVDENNLSMIGRKFISHNLWHILKINVFLDSLPLNKYTETINDNFKLSDNIKRCLDFCDM